MLGPVVVIAGTRPELIKLSPLVAELTRPDRGLGSVGLWHTGQHTDDAMSASFLREFGLRVERSFSLGHRSRGRQLGDMTAALTDAFEPTATGTVVVHGDTNSALAGALAGQACGWRVVHVEAGLRSFDRNMPEEHNRVLIDQLCDVAAAPTEHAARNLLRCGVADDRVVVTGNTVVDAIERFGPCAQRSASIVHAMGFEPHEYVFSTVHRPENTDCAAALSSVLDAFEAAGSLVVVPMHHRLRAALTATGLRDRFDRLARAGVVRSIDPVGYADALALLQLCRLAISDSGGIQEEVSVYGVPLVIPRRSTERPEILGTFGTLVAAGPDLAGVVAKVAARASTQRASLAQLGSPYRGPGGASPSRLIADAIAA